MLCEMDMLRCDVKEREMLRDRAESVTSKLGEKALRLRDAVSELVLSLLAVLPVCDTPSVGLAELEAGVESLFVADTS